MAHATRCLTACTTLLILTLLAATARPAHAAEDDQQKLTQVGFAERDITPDVGMQRPGGYGPSYHQSVHDPCKVRAAVFDDGNKRVAIVGLDALIIRRPQVEAARQRIHEECGIEPEAVLIAASHSHSSGPTGMVLPGEYDHAPENIQKLAYEKSSTADADYLKRVVDQTVAAVTAANESRQPAQCGVGSGHEDSVAFNRRFRMKNGLTFTHPRPGNPAIKEIAGPTDPEVGVIGAWDEDGKLIGCIVNYACHATTSPGGISANWIYYMEEAIRGMFGEDVVVVYSPGAGGDVTQVDNLRSTRPRGREESARFVGGRIGAEAVKVLLSVPKGPLGPVDHKTKMLEVPRRKPSPQRVEQCRKYVEAGPEETGRTRWTFAKEILLLDALIDKQPVRNVEIQALQVGPAVYLTNPAEFFCQLGLDIKARSNFPYTFPSTLTNGCVGYVPTREAFSQHGGGYETRLTSYSNLEIDAGPKFVDTAVELANQMEPGNAPERPPHRPFSGSGWSYGSVPPERE